MGNLLAIIAAKNSKKHSRRTQKSKALVGNLKRADAWDVRDGPDVKIVVAGGGGAGKSSIVLQFVHNYFPSEYDPVNLIPHISKHLEDNFRKQIVVDERCQMLEILDTAGQEEFACMKDQWYRGGEAFVLVYSITDRKSFEDVEAHVKLILLAKDAKCGPMVLIGNKSDKEEERQVATFEGKQLAESLGIPFFETSAKMRVNIDEAFQSLLREVRSYGPNAN